MFPFPFLSAHDGSMLNEIFLCFSMDLSWNYAAESQAYDRVHRLGQEKDVIVKRLVVEDTIEERMLRLQEVKMGACVDTHSLILIQY